MSVSRPRSGVSALIYLQTAAALLLGALALGVAGMTAAAAAGLVPFLTLPLQFGDTTFAQAGMVVQIAVAAVLLAVAAAMPAGLRVLALERTHRDFAISMSDVADAYRACHAADRGGVFTLKSEFDAVKERIRFLRAHPDLGHLEPDVIEAAAQMSQASRDLAETYSDENVARARGFLRHRQEEIELFHDRMERALEICRDLRRHREAVEIDEDVMESRLARLEEDHGDLLRELGFVRRPVNVVSMAPKATAAE